MIRPITRLSLLLSALALPAQADILVRFTESAPKDRFEIVNTASCATGSFDITIDLSGSAAGLIFDTTGQGQGVEVFQPFELVSGAPLVASAGRITDGDAAATLSLSDLPARGTVAFTIDVDDTLPRSSNGQIMVSRSEIAGARVNIRDSAGTVTTAAFGDDATAQLDWPACVS